MRVEKLRSESAFAALSPGWDALSDSAMPWTPFLTPTWNLAYWRHFRRDRLWVRDTLHGYAIWHDDGRLAAVAPMQLTVRPGYGPVRLRQLHYFGADEAVTELRGLICHPADEAAVVATMLKTLLAARQDWDWLQWGGVQPDGAAQANIVTARAPMASRELSNFYIDLPASFEALRARLSRNTKDALRKCYNSLSRNGHTFEFQVITRPDAVDGALDLFFHLHAARADAASSVMHRNVFTSQRSQDFLRDYAGRSAERGELRIFQLRIDGAVVATRIGFCNGRELYLYYSGYLPEWGRYSVMTTALAEALKWAIGAGLQRVSLSMGRDSSKLRWQPKEARLWEAFQISPNWRGHLMAAAFRRRAEAAPLSPHPSASRGPDEDPAEAQVSLP